MAALEELAGLVKQLPVGKRVGGDWYIHRDALERHAPTLFGVVSGYVADVAFEWNVYKLSPTRRRISLLHYPCFRKRAHPTLNAALDCRSRSGGHTGASLLGRGQSPDSASQGAADRYV